tara:strand:+ start:108 stop:470 length:363 start_codon:yes stop_codon:yes gene_type:complete
MSEDRLEAIENQLSILKNLVGLGWCILGGAFGLGCWSTLLEIRTQAAGLDIAELKREASITSQFRAESNGGKYTTSDHLRYVAEVSTTINGADKRITRLEDTTSDIKKSLDRIESKLQTK